MRTHPITGMTLEDGFGALPDDDQALRIHIPYIRVTRGDAAADAMLAQLEAAEHPAAVEAPKAAVAPEPAQAAAPEPAKVDVEAAVAAAIPAAAPEVKP